MGSAAVSGSLSSATELSNQTQIAPAVLRRNEGTRFSSPSDDEVGGYPARSAQSERKRAEQSKPLQC